MSACDIAIESMKVLVAEIVSRCISIVSPPLPDTGCTWLLYSTVTMSCMVCDAMTNSVLLSFMLSGRNSSLRFCVPS